MNIKIPMRGFLLTALVLAGLGAAPSVAFEGKPKLGPEAVPITQQTEYLRTAPAPDYWKLSPFYVPQQTSSACSLASLAMALNALRGLPARSDQRLVTQVHLAQEHGPGDVEETGGRGRQWHHV